MTRRLVLANLVLVVVVLVVLEVPLALVYSRHEHDSLNGGLQRDAAALAALAAEFVEHPTDHDVPALVRRYTGEVVTIVDAGGVEVTPPGVITSDPKLRAVLDDARAGTSSSGEADDLSYVAVPIETADGTAGAVLVARPDESIDDRVRTFWIVLAVVGAAVLGLALVVGRRLSRWVVEPLRRLDEQAIALGHGDLAARASVTGGPPEVVSLAATFNEMAGQLDALVTAQRRFVSDASHQLRTPLTALRLRLENLDPTEPTAMATTQSAALDEVARLTRLVDGLLSLARAENHRPELELLDVAAVAAERHAAWAPLAAERGVELRAAEQAPVLAAAVPGHVEQILDNLIDNALEATTAGGHVALRVESAADGIEVHVVDDGPGLSDEDRSHAFDAFWTRANGTSSKGAGLGLAIAAQLARSSGGSLRLDRSAGGGIDAVARFQRTVTRVDTAPARRHSPQ